MVSQTRKWDGSKVPAFVEAVQSSNTALDLAANAPQAELVAAANSEKVVSTLKAKGTECFVQRGGLLHCSPSGAVRACSIMVPPKPIETCSSSLMWQALEFGAFMDTLISEMHLAIKSNPAARNPSPSPNSP